MGSRGKRRGRRTRTFPYMQTGGVPFSGAMNADYISFDKKPRAVTQVSSFGVFRENPRCQSDTG